MAANPAKFQVMFLGRKESNTIEFKIEDIVLKSTNSVKLLGVIIDCKLNFHQHIEKLWNVNLEIWNVNSQHYKSGGGNL